MELLYPATTHSEILNNEIKRYSQRKVSTRATKMLERHNKEVILCNAIMARLIVHSFFNVFRSIRKAKVENTLQNKKVIIHTEYTIYTTFNSI